MAIIHPNFDSTAISIGPIAIHWYGLMYIVAFILFIAICRLQVKLREKSQSGTNDKNRFIAAQGFNKQDIDDILFYGAMGVILGGRLGYVLFYKLNYYLSNPADIMKVWQGGMSFHGGFLGVVFALILWAKLKKQSVIQLADFVAPAIPLGLAAGRIGNFINGELWGRPTDPNAWWAMIFPQAGDLAAGIARHPSQLYQAGLEGITLFIIVWWFARKPSRPAGSIIGLFVAGYGVCRFIVEFAREPDAHLGLFDIGLSMGQLLSIPMIIVGAALMIIGYRNKTSLG
jgi:phosphatidylglycerol---prolipoprotein diacylglyceryl transferase